jgi:xanthine dehydrogenase accessory factor
MNHEVFAALGEALSRGEEAALVTIVSSNGSTPQRVGAKMLVFADGHIVGTVGGGCYEHDAIGVAKQVLATRKARTVKYDLNDDFAEETGLVCGGQMEVFIEPIEASPSVYIFGAGHVGFYLARLIQEAGFGVHVIDDRAAFANAERFPKAASIVVDDIPQWLARTTIPPTSYVVIVTRGHRNDLDVLREIAPRDLRYIGLIGSRAKVARLYEAVLAEGRIASDQLERIHAPIGLDIGAVTPQEIEVSIAAEMIAVRRGNADALKAASLQWMPTLKALR